MQSSHRVERQPYLQVESRLASHFCNEYVTVGRRGPIYATVGRTGAAQDAPATSAFHRLDEKGRGNRQLGR